MLKITFHTCNKYTILFSITTKTWRYFDLEETNKAVLIFYPLKKYYLNVLCSCPFRWNWSKGSKHSHVYHEGTALKESKNIAFFILKTVADANISHENGKGIWSSIVFDNCSEHNTENTILILTLTWWSWDVLRQ